MFNNKSSLFKYNMVWAFFFSLMLLPLSLSFFIDNQSLKYVFLLINLFFMFLFFVITWQMIIIYAKTFSLINFYKNLGYKANFKKFKTSFNYIADYDTPFKIRETEDGVEKFAQWNGYNNWSIAYPDGRFIESPGFNKD